MQKACLGDFWGPLGARTSEEKESERKNDSRTRHLRTNPQMPRA